MAFSQFAFMIACIMYTLQPQSIGCTSSSRWSTLSGHCAGMEQTSHGQHSPVLSNRKVLWNWLSDATGCTWVTIIQWCRRTKLTAPRRTVHSAWITTRQPSCRAYNSIHFCPYFAHTLVDVFSRTLLDASCSSLKNQLNVPRKQNQDV